MSSTWTDDFQPATSVTAVEDPQGIGVFLQVTPEKAASRHVLPLGRLPRLSRFTACYRYEPFWMRPQAGTRTGAVPVETQSLLTESDDGTCTLLIPLVSGIARCSLQGGEDDLLQVVIETGDPSVVVVETVCAFVATGPDPFALLEEAARSVCGQIAMGRLRRDKDVPSFIDSFGWCTWDAFYQDVSEEKVRLGLNSFRNGGVLPKYLILDDGWQSERTVDSGERRLTAFEANEKFPAGLGPTVRTAKDDFGLDVVLVWHAMTGYWGGVDREALPGYGVRNVPREFSPGLRHYGMGPEEYWGKTVGLVSPEQIYRFFQDYHRHLRAQGVDGIKVDTQATLEGVAVGYGGRVELMRRYHEALEGSAQVHFQGNLINCMSCASEMLYGAPASTLTRTSTDFWPNDPASHGLHLYCNAQVSAWFGEFIQPDWDMFQSGHPMGEFHAAGRAVGGCPVYVSDKPGAHDFALLRKLVLPDGSILRADGPGRPTRDCLFRDPTREDVLLKIWNRNGDAGVIGVFNAHPTKDGEDKPLTGTVSPADIPGMIGEYFAVYAHHSGTLRRLRREDTWPIELAPLTAEVFTLVPIIEGFAPIGLVDLFNSAGAVTDIERQADGVVEIRLRGGGRFLAWCDRYPLSVEAAEGGVGFEYDPIAKRLSVTLSPQPQTVRVLLPAP